jgi:hypothetical protein
LPLISTTSLSSTSMAETMETLTLHASCSSGYGVASPDFGLALRNFSVCTTSSTLDFI